MNAVSGNGFTALMEAIRARHSFVVELLLERKAQLGPVSTGTGSMKTPLHNAAQSGGYDIFLRVLESSSCVYAVDADGMTPLMEAARAGDAYLVKDLWYRDAKVNAKTNDGNTALHFAAAAGHVVTCQALVECGAKIDEENQEGKHQW